MHRSLMTGAHAATSHFAQTPGKLDRCGEPGAARHQNAGARLFNLGEFPCLGC